MKHTPKYYFKDYFSFLLVVNIQKDGVLLYGL